MSKPALSFSEFKRIVKGSRGFRLLTVGNPKTAKGEGHGYFTYILHLSPARLSGFEVCAGRTKGCTLACLNTAGRGGIMAGQGILTHADVANGVQNTIQRARINRTRLFFTDRAAFMALLVKEIGKAIRLARKNDLVPVFRLNGTSDIRWESIAIDGAASIMSLFPDVQFYDYTKLPNRKNVPANYALTFSLADGNEVWARMALNNGMNVAAVFRDESRVARAISEGFLGRPVFNGDMSDLRFLDPKGHVIALYAKGNAKGDQSGFVRD